jgi:hypothetical protein
MTFETTRRGPCAVRVLKRLRFSPSFIDAWIETRVQKSESPEARHQV